MVFYEWVIALVDKGRVTDLDRSKAFETVTHNILVSKLERCGSDWQNTCWIRTLLYGCTPRVAVKSLLSRWRPVMTGIPHRSVLGPVLFSIFFRGTDSGIECILRKFADKSKLSSEVDTLEGRNIIPGDLDRLERWAHVNVMQFNKAKCNLLHLSRGNTKHRYSLGNEGIKSTPDEKDLGVLVDEKLNKSWQ